MRLLITLILPWLKFFTIGRPIAGIICLILQITLIGWLPAAIWAAYALSQCNIGQKTEKHSTAGMYSIDARRKKYSHADSVNALFDKIAGLLPASALNAEWLANKRRQALDKTPGWKAALDAYLHGLAVAEHVATDAAAELRAALAECLDSEAAAAELLLPLVWIAVVATVAVTCGPISMGWLFMALMFLLIAGAGGWWASKRSWLRPGIDPRQPAWGRAFTVIFCMVTVPLLTFGISLIIGIFVQEYSISRFNTDRAAFMADPQGFPMLRKFALTNYGIEVLLGDEDDSWASTAANLPRASVASMSLGPGYCLLSMYREKVLHDFPPVGKASNTLWIQGVMMHEFGHCLDLLRDFPAFGEHAVHVHSIAPIDAKGVTDLQSYLSAMEKNSTKLWREALADTFAVGYWRLAASREEAGRLAASLRRKRSDAAEEDKTHATMCWIDHALHAAPPSSGKDLMSWADQQRDKAQCVIPKPGKRITALMKFQEYIARLTHDSK